MRVVLGGAAMVTVVISALILFVLFRGAIDFFRSIGWDFGILVDDSAAPGWFPRRERFDLLTIVLGSIVMGLLAMIVAVPLGLGTAVYLSEYAPPRVRRIVKPAVEVLAGIPSVIVGYFALKFIAPNIVNDAIAREKYKDETAPVVMGIDPARGGMDSTVIVVRQGRDIVAIKRFKGEDTMSIVGRVIDAIEEYKPVLSVIDEGGLGYGILDRLNEQRYKVRGVNFGWKAKNSVMWGNKRAEMWGAMREWLRTASLPDDRQLKADLIGPMKKPNSSGTIFLEGKKEMRARGLASPDAADALAVTFAFPVAHREYVEKSVRRFSSGGANFVSWMGS